MGINSRTITKTRRKLRDVDQIKADLLSSRHLAQFKDGKRPEDLPGLGRNYCVECAKWFDTETTLKAHQRGKPHKRRLKQLRDEPDPDPRRVPVGQTTSKLGVQQRNNDLQNADLVVDMEVAT